MNRVTISNQVFNPGAVRVLNRVEEIVQRLELDALLVVRAYINLLERGFTVNFDEVNGEFLSHRESPMVGFSESRFSDYHIVVYSGMLNEFNKHGLPTEEVWERRLNYEREDEAAHMILSSLITRHPQIDNDLIRSLDED